MNVEMVLQVPVSLILVTCSVTWGLSNHHDEDTGEDDDDGEDEDEDDDGDGDGDDDDAGDANHSLPLGYAQMKFNQHSVARRPSWETKYLMSMKS